MLSTILVLDANQRSALAVTRSLGRLGLKVLVADAAPASLAGSSRYCRRHFAVPCPSRAPRDFLDAIRTLVTAQGIDLLLPMTDVTTALVLANRESLGGVRIPFADFASYETASDKFRLFEYARDHGIPMPRTWFIDSPAALERQWAELPFPVVLKPSRSSMLIDAEWIRTSVSVARSADELHRQIASCSWFPRYPLLLQEYVQGEGRGLFVLYDHGRPLAFFAHRRLREKPPQGGISVLSESVAVDPDMRRIAEDLLTPLKWHGVAMVEFKLGADGTPYLMEINARFWGSLQLAIDAGVDFPALLYRLENGETLAPISSYKTGIRSRWLLGDLDRLYLVLKDRSHYSMRDKLGACLQFLHLVERNTQYEVNRWSDPAPFLFELRRYAADLMGSR